MTDDEILNLNLKSFIDENQKAISLIGVFVALTVFSISIVKVKLFSILLSILSINICILLLRDISKQVPLRYIIYPRLKIFVVLLKLIVYVLLAYGILEYRTYLVFFLTPLLLEWVLIDIYDIIRTQRFTIMIFIILKAVVLGLGITDYMGGYNYVTDFLTVVYQLISNIN